MFLRNKNKFLMYKILHKFENCKSIGDTKNFIVNKYKIDENYFSYLKSFLVNHIMKPISFQEILLLFPLIDTI